LKTFSALCTFFFFSTFSSGNKSCKRKSVLIRCRILWSFSQTFWSCRENFASLRQTLGHRFVSLPDYSVLRSLNKEFTYLFTYFAWHWTSKLNPANQLDFHHNLIFHCKFYELSHDIHPSLNLWKDSLHNFMSSQWRLNLGNSWLVKLWSLAIQISQISHIEVCKFKTKFGMKLWSSFSKFGTYLGKCSGQVMWKWV